MRRRTLLAAPLLALPSIARGQGSVLRFVPQADVAVLDPIWTTSYQTRDHAFLVFDTLLRRRFLDADPDRWPALAQDVLEGTTHGQSFGVAVRRALARGRITEDEARARLKEWGHVA